jgi:hypothetical protein
MLSISECTVKRCVKSVINTLDAKGGQAIVDGWSEPHYLGSPGLMSTGPVIVYTTKYEEELEVCHFFVSESYCFACNAMNLGDRSHSYV